MRVVLHIALVAAFLITPFAAHAQGPVPTLTQAFSTQSLATNGAPVTIDLSRYFSLPGVTGPVAQFNTVQGTFNVELLTGVAPKTVANFMNYVNRGAYTNSLIHRSVPGFVIQGGGFTLSGNTLAVVATDPPVQNEFKNSNLRGTLAMAKTDAAPDSATSQWFVNLADNSASLNNQNGGFTVFARVLGSGMTAVVDVIAALPLFDATLSLGSAFSAVPVAVAGTLNSQTITLVKSIKVVQIYPADNSGQAVLSFVLANNNSAVVSAALTGSTLMLTPVGAGTATLSIRAADTNGNVVSTTLNVTVASGESAPVITTQPMAQIAAPGSTVVFNAGAIGIPTPTYQWQFNGTDIAGATGPRLVLSGGSGKAGFYSVVISNSVGRVTSANAALTYTATSDFGRLINLSVLTTLTPTDSSFTVGTVVGGGTTGVTKPLLVRAGGPSLALVGVPAADALADPSLQFFSGSTVVASNDNWGSPVGSGASDSVTLRAVFARLGAFDFASTASKDSAIYNAAFPAGSYTVTVNGVGGATGTVLAEIYDGTIAGAFTAGTPRLLNVSVLKNIVAGGSVTAGFVIGGGTARTVLIRGIGPGLAGVGVAGGTLADPQIALFNGASQQVAANDNWGGDSQITAAGSTVGAFAVSDVASKDAMLLVTLAPGSYSAIVSGVGTASGLAIVEVYEVP